jgi:SAM-dependent methyltransferase
MNQLKAGSEALPALGRLTYLYRAVKLRLSGLKAKTTPGSALHFVRDYEHLVLELLSKFPLDEAMARAVGGAYDAMGHAEAGILKHVGLRNGMDVVDLGCGSGRLPHALGKDCTINYTGIDIIAELLDYARTKSPPHYRFILNRTYSLPVPDASADMATAFSVFTHLFPEETYLYLEDMRRILRPGGRVVFSFLDFAEDYHWTTFEEAVANKRAGKPSHINAFLARDTIALWSEKLGYECETFIGAQETIPGGSPLGQSVAVLRCA